MWVLLLAAIGSGVALAFLAFLSRDGEAPGLEGNRLKPCPSSPNCVCSEGDSEGRAIAPLSFRGDARAAWAAVREAIASQGGELQAEEDLYAWATFSTPVFGFVDDLEIQIDAEAEFINVRSASRIGYSDMGANRARVEALRTALMELTACKDREAELNPTRTTSKQ